MIWRIVRSFVDDITSMSDRFMTRQTKEPSATCFLRFFNGGLLRNLNEPHPQQDRVRMFSPVAEIAKWTQMVSSFGYWKPLQPFNDLKRSIKTSPFKYLKIHLFFFVMLFFSLLYLFVLKRQQSHLPYYWPSTLRLNFCLGMYIILFTYHACYVKMFDVHGKSNGSSYLYGDYNL